MKTVILNVVDELNDQLVKAITEETNKSGSSNKNQAEEIAAMQKLLNYLVDFKVKQHERGEQ